MKIILYLSIVIVFVGCNAEIKDDNVPTSKIEALTMLGEDSIEAETKEAELSGDIILKARGFEPGWYAEFYADRVKLLLNYGKDSLTWKADFSDLKNKKNFKSSMKENNNGKEAELTIILKEESCTEAASGDNKEQSITIIYNNQSYSGCAGR